MPDEIPFASRPFGWCQDYATGPAARHEKCDGLIEPPNPYHCPCSCHTARKKRVIRRKK